MTHHELFAQIRGITLDLDDTLWAVLPVIRRAEERIRNWFGERFPDQREHFTADRLQHYRRRVDDEEPEWSYDLTRQRSRAFEIMLSELGLDPAVADEAIDCFLGWRQDVELFPGAESCLADLSRRFPLASLSNGNADVGRIGIGSYFAARVSAGRVGARKPHPEIFLAACAELGLPSEQVLHIGDHPVDDVAGAAAVGMRTLWIGNEGGMDPGPTRARPSGQSLRRYPRLAGIAPDAGTKYHPPAAASSEHPTGTGRACASA